MLKETNRFVSLAAQWSSPSNISTTWLALRPSSETFLSMSSTISNETGRKSGTFSHFVANFVSVGRWPCSCVKQTSIPFSLNISAALKNARLSGTSFAYTTLQKRIISTTKILLNPIPCIHSSIQKPSFPSPPSKQINQSINQSISRIHFPRKKKKENMFIKW